VGQVLPSIDSCDQVDNDCDGQTDEESDVPGCILYYQDLDSDGSTNNALGGMCLCKAQNLWPTPTKSPGFGDCCDLDDDAYPGQEAFFTEPMNPGCGYAEGSEHEDVLQYDFNCDGDFTLEVDNVANCKVSLQKYISDPGWVSSAIPECGESALFNSIVCNEFTGEQSDDEALAVQGCQ